MEEKMSKIKRKLESNDKEEEKGKDLCQLNL